MVDHPPLFEFLCDSGFCLHAAKFIIKAIAIASSFMLCSFDTSTEASAPAVLSLCSVAPTNRSTTKHILVRDF